MTAEPLLTVWPTVDGLAGFPLLCCTASMATQLAVDLDRHHLASQIALVPCCRTSGGACIRDQWDDDDLDEMRAAELLQRAADHHRFPWPADAAEREPEYSVLPEADR